MPFLIPKFIKGVKSMQTLIDISAVEEDFFIAILNDILTYKKESKKQIWDSSVCLSLNK